MRTVDIDFSTAPTPDPDGEPPNYIQPGWYMARITSVTMRRSQKHNNYFDWTFEFPSVHPEFSLHYVTVIDVPAATYRLQDLIEACTGIRPYGKITFDAGRLLQSEIQAKIETDHYMHQLKNVIAEVAAP